MTNFELTLVKSYLINLRTRHLEFKIINHDSFNFNAGQFISLHIKKNSEIIRRNFSIANAPNQLTKNTIEIAATFVPNGIASSTLWSMQIGEHLEASGPYGIFVLKPEDFKIVKRCILVATGTGVTPYRSMLNNLQILLQQHQELTIVLLLGVRDKQELLYGNDFVNFAKNNSKFKFIACYSRQSDNIDVNFENTGYVQNKLLQLNINPKQDLIYLCGNPNMIDQSLSALEALGMPKNKIRREKYISTPIKLK